MIGMRILTFGIAAILFGCAGCTVQPAAFASDSYAAAHRANSPSTDDNPFPPPPAVDLPKLDPISGHMIAPTGSGAYVDPFTGTLYGPVGGGALVNTQTGALIPG